MTQSQRSPSSTASRREFLKTSAVGMAAASGLPLARSAHAAGSEAIKIGMLGCGGRCSGVLIACASKYHPFYAEEAVKAGKHVFVEKPHAIDPAGCRQLKRLCELAKQKNVSVVSGHESRYSPAYAEMVQRIHDGAIGNIVSIQSMFLRAAYQTVARDPSLNETECQFSNWYHFRSRWTATRTTGRCCGRMPPRSSWSRSTGRSWGRTPGRTA